MATTTEKRRGTLISRLRIPLAAIGGVMSIAGAILSIRWLALPGLALFVVGMVLYFRFGAVKAAPIPVSPPVRGTWTVINSPSSKMPSHGLHAYGQTYAVDLVPNADGEDNLSLGWDAGMRPPDRYRGFGEKVYSPVEGTVVAVKDGARDHLSRDSWPALGFFFAESAARELTGPGRLLGNHVTIEVEPGVYAVLAHLRRNSIAVRPGDRVRPGQEVGACGNSGSSTQPHLHFQLMDRKSPLIGAGLPFEFRVGGKEIPLPGNGELLTA